MGTDAPTDKSVRLTSCELTFGRQSIYLIINLVFQLSDINCTAHKTPIL